MATISMPSTKSWYFSPAGQSPRGDILVCIFQRGGVDGLNVVVPAGDPDYYNLRPTIAIPEPKSGSSQTAVDLDGYFALHPALAPLQPLFHDGQMAIVHAVGLPDPTHSHFDAQDNLERGDLSSKTTPSGWLGRHLASLQEANPSPLRAVGIGPLLQASLRGPQPAVALRSLVDFRLTGRLPDMASYQQSLQSLYLAPSDGPMLRETATEIHQVMDLLSRLNVAAYRPSSGATYPGGDFGKNLMEVAQLIKAEVGLEVACLDIGGWDTHANEGGADGVLDKLLAELGQGLAAFAADLGDRFQDVLVVTMSEFGRRAQENGSQGTDHGHGNAMFLLGGGVSAGKVFGAWPTLAPDKLDGPGDLATTSDYRDVLGEAISRRLGNTQAAAVFPGYSPRELGVLKPR